MVAFLYNSMYLPLSGIFMSLYSFKLMFCVSAWGTPFSISCREGLVEAKSLSFCSPRNVLISRSFGKTILLNIKSWLKIFSFSTLIISSHFLLASRISGEKSVDNFIVDPLYVTSCFSFDAFSVFFWSLAFDSLIIMCLGMVVFKFSYKILEFTQCIWWSIDGVPQVL